MYALTFFFSVTFIVVLHVHIQQGCGSGYVIDICWGLFLDSIDRLQKYKGSKNIFFMKSQQLQNTLCDLKYSSAL